MTLLYAENGRGKTTLCDILRSFQTGVPDYVTARKTLGADEEPGIELRVSDDVVRFQDNAWTTTCPDIAIYDSTFVHENVYAGDNVDHEHKKNLYRVIVGAQGVALAHRVNQLDESITEANRDIRTKQRALTSHVPQGVLLDIEEAVADEGLRQAAALKSFANWAVTTGRLLSNPLSAIKRLNGDACIAKRRRRALTEEEIGALLGAAVQRPIHEITTIRTGRNKGKQLARVRSEVREECERLGQERQLAYCLALRTGLRRSELAALEWRDIEFDSLPPRIALRAETTKSIRADTIPLHPQITKMLRDARPHDARPRQRVLRTVPSMRVLKADLTFGGIEFENDRGRADFHAMRMTFGTQLAAHGIALRVAQALLRHKDPRLTANVYTDESLLPKAQSISKLPPLPVGPDQEAVPAAALGEQRKRQQWVYATGHAGAQPDTADDVGEMPMARLDTS